MNYGILFSLSIAHLLADFVLQTQKMIQDRQSPNTVFMIKGNLRHSVVHGLLSSVLLFYYIGILYTFLIGLLVFVSHMVIDLVKSLILKKRPYFKYNFLVFLVDQVIHFFLLFIIAQFVGSKGNVSNLATSIWNKVKPFFYGFHYISYEERILLCIALIILALWGVGVFIRIFVEGMKFKPYKRALQLNILIAENSEDKGVRDGGFLIGILERLVIICAVVTNMTNLIGFLVTVKSIARFKKFDDDGFVEYFIIGSFMSIISAVITGLIIRKLGIFPY